MSEDIFSKENLINFDINEEFSIENLERRDKNDLKKQVKKENVKIKDLLRLQLQTV